MVYDEQELAPKLLPKLLPTGSQPAFSFDIGIMLLPIGSLALHSLFALGGESRASDRWEILVRRTSSGLAAVKMRDLQF